MGLFDKFRKKIHKAVEEIDVDTLTTGEEQETLPPIDEIKLPLVDEEDWEELNEEEPLTLKSNEEEWEEWDADEPELTLPTKLSRKEKRIRDKELKKSNSQKRAKQKELKNFFNHI